MYDGLKVSTGAAIFSLVASVSVDWTFGGAALVFDHLTTLNSKRSWFTLLGAPGKRNEVHASVGKRTMHAELNCNYKTPFRAGDASPSAAF